MARQVSELLDRFVNLFNAGRYEESQADYAPDGYDEEVGTGRADRQSQTSDPNELAGLQAASEPFRCLNLAIGQPEILPGWFRRVKLTGRPQTRY